MANGIRTDDPSGYNKGRSSKFREGSRVRKAGGHIGGNVVEITIKMKTIVRKPLMIKSFIKDPFFVIYIDMFEKQFILSLKENFSLWIYFSLRV